MATRKRTELEESLMTSSNIELVISKLNPSDPSIKAITKKDACAILGMTYNTKRLDSIIEEHLKKKADEKRRRAEKRGKPITRDEEVYAISMYLEGQALEKISTALYRTTAAIKEIIATHNVPTRCASPDYFNPRLIPEPLVRTEFAENEIVFSARYNSVARVIKEAPTNKFLGKVYQIWLPEERWKQFAYQPASELASLQHLKELGVPL